MQVLRANRATHAALGYRLHHGPGHVVHYGSAPTVTAVAPDSSRSFCLSREKLTLQQLNSRLAVYLQQVQFLEAANQQLECQIQKEMERKCPGELRQLDKHLRTVSLLQDQISECLSSQAQMKLELLSAELTVFDLNIRCEKERECCGRLDVEFSNLKQLGEELQVHRLPELQCQLDEQTQQLMEMETQHQEDMQVLLAQMSDVTVEMQPAESLDLIQQLDDLRRTSVTPLFNNQDECWFDTQGPVLSSPEVTTDSPLESEVMQTELLELRRRAMSLEEELTQLKAVNSMLEASGLEQHQSFIQQLVVLQQNADYLCGDLDSVLQATVQQAADCQILLDAKTRLEAEIEDYRRLLDGPSSHGLSSIHPSAVANVTAFCATTSPSAFSRDITLNQTVNVQEGSLRMMDVQAVSGGHIRTIGQTPVAAPLSETVTTVQPIRIHNTFPQSSPVTSIHTSNLMGLFKSESRRTGVLPERTGTESITISASINRQSSHVEEKVSAEDRDLQKSLIVSSQISQGLDDRAVVKDSKVETNNAQGVTTLVSDTQSARSTALQAAYKQTTTKAGLQANKTETNVQTEITKTILYKEPEVKQETQLVTHRIITDPSKERSVQAKNQNAAEVVSLETTEAVEEKVAVTPFVVSGSHILMSREAQVSGNLTLMDDQDIERQEKKEEKEIAEVEGSLRVLRLDQSSALSNASNSEQNKVTENADTGSGIELVSSDNLESKTAQRIITLVPDTQSARIDAVQAKPESLTSKETTTETNIQTEITKTILRAEPEVKQETHLVTHTTTTESSQQTAAEVKKETESLITAQSSCTESSIQAENQGPAQVVSLSLEVQTEAVRDAGKVAVPASVISRSHILTSEEAQVKVSSDLSLKDDKDIVRQEKKEEKEIAEVEGSLHVLRLDQSSVLSNASNSEQNKATENADTGSGIALVSSDNLESKTAQGIITLVPDTQSARIDAVQAKPETLISKETTTETNIQTEITKTILCAEPEVKQETHLVTHTTTTESSQQTAAEVKKETESLITAQSSCTESSIQAENQGPAQVVSLSLEVQTEAIGDAGKVAVTSSVASRSHTLGSEEAQVKVSSDLSLKDDKDIERQEKEEEKEVVKVEGSLPVLRLHQTPALSDASNSQQNNVMEDANTVSGNAVASSGSPDSNDNLGSKTASTEILKKVEVEVNKGKGVNSFHDRTKEEGQSLSTSRDQAVPEKDRNDTNNSRPTSRGIGFQLSSLGGLEFRGPGHCSIIADKEMQLSFGGQYKEGNSGDRLGQDDQKEEKNSDQLVTNMPDNSKGVLNECVKSAKVGSVSAKEGTTSSSVASNSGALTNSNSGMASDLAAISGGMAPNSSCTVSSNVEECRRDIGQKMVDEGSLNVSDTRSKESPAGTTLPATSQQETGRFSKSGTGERIVHGGSLRRESSLDGSRSLPSTEKEEGPSMATNPATSLQGKGRFGSEDWIVYSGSLGRKKNLSRTRSVESQSAAMLPSTSMPEIRTCGSGERGDGMVYRGLKHTSGLADSDNLPNTESTESLPTIATSPQGTAKFGSRGSVGSGEWRVYGGSSGRMSSWAGSNSLPNLDKEESPSAVAQLPTSPPGSLRAGRFSSAGSAEWRVYGGSTGRLSSAGSADRVSISANHDQMTNPPSSQKSSGRRLSSASSGGKLSSGSVVKRSRSLGSGGNLSSSSSGGRLSNSSGSLRASTSVRYTSTGSGEWKPVYSSTSARKSSAGSTGRSGGGGRISSQKAPNPGGRMIVSMGSGGWLNSSTAGGVSIGSTGSGSKLNSTGGSDRISSRAGGRISSSSGSGRTNSTGGRVITSSDRPIRSTGSATGGNKERISVCKMAALSISAAGRERSQDRQRQQQQQQKGAATSPLLQRWLSAGVGVKTADPDDLDDVAPL